MELRGLLGQYRDISLELINSLNNDNDISGLLVEKREELLAQLKDGNFSKEELVKVANEFELIKIEERVMESIMTAREEVRSQIIELNKKKEANRTYGSNFKNINFINKKI